MAKRYRALINGEWTGDDLAGIGVLNPYDDTLIGIVPEATPELVEKSIVAARHGFRTNSALPASYWAASSSPISSRSASTSDAIVTKLCKINIDFGSNTGIVYLFD